jgi:PAS domain S-box-containing protein
MTSKSSTPSNLVNVLGTELLPTDTRELYRQKLARITLDSMVQFVGLLDAKGTVLEINKVALDAVGIKLADVEGKPFWTTFWWQVSEEVNATLRESIRRAAEGEFVRWDTEIYGRAGGKETIIIDASLMPVRDEQGKVAFITAEGRDITEKKAHEREITRQREELAQLDVLKTQFFANISHEFRTPLTLMMGPLEDAIAAAGELSAINRERLELAHRNSIRLLKLVNTLLDFSRLEAGRIEASYQPTDLSILTADLASVFRSAIERAGLQLIIECPPLPEMVYVDHEMWEKIVLNLLSNAFKFTFEGEIEVSLRAVDSAVELTVRDTGTGIAENEIPRLFERFHRVKGARGRSYEGSGIGLAFVQELVRLHGGSVRVESEIDRGTRFIVSIPLGTAHLPPGRIQAPRTLSSTSLSAAAYVDEAERWSPTESEARSDEPMLPALTSLSGIPRTDVPDSQKEIVVIADDNADMREYLVNLLRREYQVHAVTDGIKAVEAARKLRPALVLTDVMMPGLDGFGVLREIRNDSSLSGTPVILLSARAGEESRVEGLRAGADDYLVKPFSARELLARVGGHLQLARARQEAEASVRESGERFRALVNASSYVIYRMSPDWKEMRQLDGHGFLADTAEPRMNWIDEYIPQEDQADVLRAIERAIQTRSTFELEHRIRRMDGTSGWAFSRAVPILNDKGAITEWFGAASDVTERKHSYLKSQQLSAIVSSSDDAIVSKDLNSIVTSWNSAAEKMFGFAAEEMIGSSILKIIPPELQDDEERILRTIASGERIDHFETVRVTKGGERIDVSITVSPLQDDTGRIVGAAKIARDITQHRKAERALHTAERLASVGRLAATVAHEINNPLEALTNLIYLAKRGASKGADVVRYLAAAEEELDRVSHLAKQTLGFYRETSSVSTVRVGSMITSLLPVFTSRMRNKGIDLINEIKGDPEVQAIPGEIRQVIANLISNSIDAVDSGGRIRIRATAISEWNGNGREGVRLTVADSGSGIPDKVRARLFEPFFTTKQEIGTGLGLWVCKTIVDKHRGKIRVKSCTTPEKSWTVFSIFLPVNPE